MSRSESQEQFWSNDPNAPKIRYYVYVAEKSRLAGVSLGPVLYGILVVLFFQCIAALLSSANRRKEGIKWWLVSYTVLIFSFATTLFGTGTAFQFDAYIDNREYPGVEGETDPGPLGYQEAHATGALLLTDALMFQLAYALADGFLLYRCHMIYAKNLWAIALPCLLYLTAVGFGIMALTVQALGLNSVIAGFDVSIVNDSLSLSLNILLTLMIVVRLVLHGRSVRTATGSPAGLSGLYETLATMFIESSAIYAGNSLVLIGLWATSNPASYAFIPALTLLQVIAPLLIIKRIAKRTALTSDTITGQTSSFMIKSQGEPTRSTVLPAGGDPVRSVGEFRVGETNPVDIRRDTSKI